MTYGNGPFERQRTVYVASNAVRIVSVASLWIVRKYTFMLDVLYLCMCVRAKSSWRMK